MSTTHVGKIGRLLKCTRDELGRRIEDNEPGKELVNWLNGLSDVQEILNEQFGGRPITEQNLSEWKQTGHPEWFRQEQTRSLVSTLTEQSDDLNEAADGQEISDRFAGMFAAELIWLITSRLEKETDPEKRWKIICEAHRELSQLRRDDHRAVRTFIKRERWNRQVAREDEEAEKREEKEEIKRRVDRYFAIHEQSLLAECLGGGEYGKKWADWLVRVQHGLSMPDWARTDNRGPDAPAETKPSPTKSDPIQANPTNFSNGHAPFAGVHDYVI
ncbi:MAG TPA: hypothetical protein VMB22_06365 [Verrucomicrobiae bacterium]|nr:hypothetical protein [Verrucomicrobiae bacterium]